MLNKTILKATAAWCLIVTPVASVEAQSLRDMINILGGGNQNGQNGQNGQNQGNGQNDGRSGVNAGNNGNGRGGNNGNTGGMVGCGVIGGAAAIFIKGTLGKILGGLIGCFAGWKLGQALTKRDKEAVSAQSIELMANNDGPAEATLVAPDSKQQVTLRTEQAQQVNDYAVDFAVDNGVQAPTQGTKVNPATYVVAVQRLNFRSSPEILGDSNIIGYFSRAEKVEVMGTTADSEWVLLGDEGVLVGYAKLRDGRTALLVPPGTRLPTVGAQRVARAKPRIVRNTAAPASAVGQVRVAPAGGVGTARVRVATSCKAVVASSGSASDRRNGCALPNGAWAIS